MPTQSLWIEINIGELDEGPRAIFPFFHRKIATTQIAKQLRA